MRRSPPIACLLTPTIVLSPAIDLALIVVGRVGDLLLREAPLDRRDHPPIWSMRSMYAIASCSTRSGQRLDEVGAPSGSIGVRDPRLLGDDLLRSAERRSPPPRSGAPAPRRTSRCGATACRRAPPPSAWTVTRATLLSGCCAVSEQPAVCVWKRSIHERGFFAPNRSRITCAQMRRAARSFGDLLEEVVVRVEEERQPRREVVDVKPGGERRLDVGDAVGQREGELLDRGRAGLADVVAGDRDRVPLRNVARCRTPSGR